MLFGAALTILLIHTGVQHGVVCGCAPSESVSRRVHVVPLMDGADASELVVAEETLTLNDASNLRRHMYQRIDPFWGELAGPEGSTIEWEACGGAFRQEWELASVAGATSHNARRAFEQARAHVRCGTSWASLCTPQRGQGWNESTYARFAAKTMSLLGTLSSIPLQWESTTPQHQRPMGIGSFVSGYTRCGVFLATESTMCTQHLVPMLQPSGSSSFLTDVVPSLPFLLRTGWHHLHVTVARSGGTLTVSHRLSFVLLSRSDRSEWLRHTNHNAALQHLIVWEQRSSTKQPVSTTLWKTSMRLVSDSDALGSMVIEICRPSAYPTTQAPARLLLLFPTSVIRPLMHKLQHHVTVRLARFDDQLSTLVVLLDVMHSRDGLCSVVVVPFTGAYAPLAERPPDANKRYVIPQPMIRVARLAEDCSGSPLGDDQELLAWRNAFTVPGERSTPSSSDRYRYLRIAASEAPRISLPVPDAAMVFNAISIGLLPFSVLLGTILRRTGRQTA